MAATFAKKNSRLGAARESLVQRSTSRRAVLLCFDNNDTWIVELWLFQVPRQQNLAENLRRGAALESLAQRSTSRPDVLLS